MITCKSKDDLLYAFRYLKDDKLAKGVPRNLPAYERTFVGSYGAVCAEEWFEQVENGVITVNHVPKDFWY